MTVFAFIVLQSRWLQPAYRLLACLLLVGAAIDARCEEPGPIRVVVWDERQPEQKQAYDNFLGNEIAARLGIRPGITVRSVSLDDADVGLSVPRARTRRGCLRGDVGGGGTVSQRDGLARGRGPSGLHSPRPRDVSNLE